MAKANIMDNISIVYLIVSWYMHLKQYTFTAN